MGLYDRPSTELVWLQINRDNPQLPKPLNANNVVLLQGPLTTGLGDTGRNTRAIFNGVPGKGYSGKVQVFYDRLRLDQLFKDIVLRVRIPYLATTRTLMLNAVNAALGLQLSNSDITDGNTVVAPSTAPSGSLTFTASTTCLAFTGSFVVAYTRDEPSFADIYLNKSVNVWDDISGNTLVWRKSFHPYLTALTNVARGTSLRSTTANSGPFLTAIRNWSGLPFILGSVVSDDPYDITDAVVTYLPTVDVPDANQNYKNVFILTPSVKNRWQLPFYFHVNPRDAAEVVKASYEDFTKFLALNPAYSVVPADAAVATYLSKTVVYNVGNTAAGHQMAGTSWGDIFRVAGSHVSRPIQHAFPTKALYDDSFANKRFVIMQFGPTVGASGFGSVNRNGYLSAPGGGGDATYAALFVYYDSVDKCMKRTVPLNNNNPTFWLP